MTAAPNDRRRIPLDRASEEGAILRSLFASQKLATLATSDQSGPYVNLVAFAATQDLTGLIFVTPRQTRKYVNLTTDARAAMLIDSRSNDVKDFEAATAVTATGRVIEAGTDQRQALIEPYLHKHPHLETFATAETSALFCLDVERYVVVTEFERVTEIIVEE